MALPLMTLAWQGLHFHNSFLFSHFLFYTFETNPRFQMYHLHTHLALALVLSQSAFSWTAPSSAYKRSSDQHELKDRLGAVASESSVCSKIGVDLIKDGGNAADAVCLKELSKSHSKLANRNNVQLAVGWHSFLCRRDRNVPQRTRRWWFHDRTWQQWLVRIYRFP